MYGVHPFKGWQCFALSAFLFACDEPIKKPAPCYRNTKCQQLVLAKSAQLQQRRLKQPSFKDADAEFEALVKSLYEKPLELHTIYLPETKDKLIEFGLGVKCASVEWNISFEVCKVFIP